MAVDVVTTAFLAIAVAVFVFGCLIILGTVNAREDNTAPTTVAFFLIGGALIYSSTLVFLALIQ